MVFEYTLTVAAGKTEAEPATLDMPIAAGVIHRIEVDGHPGCNGMVYVTINRALHQVFPTNPDGQFRPRGFPKAGTVYEELLQPPFELTAKGWSPDCTYPHDITISLWILPKERLEAERGLIGGLKRMLKHMRMD